MRLLVFLLCSLIATNACALSNDLQSFLRNQAGFSQVELHQLEQGKVLTKLLDTGSKPEVAVLGVMHVDVPANFFVERFRDIETFMKSDQVMAISRFDAPPQLSDLDGLTLAPGELLAIRECEVGNCDMKLPASVIERFRHDVDWTRPDYPNRVTALVKQMLLEYVKAYLIGGDEAMGQYDDQKYPLKQANAFHELLLESDYLYEHAPELYEYIELYPKVDLPNAEDFIFWSMRKYERLRPIVSINHVTIFRRSHGEAKTLIGSKQIYANHYFEASFELTALVEEETAADSSGFFLLYLNRSRLDTLRKKALPGMQHTIRSEILNKIDLEMSSTKSLIEALYQMRNSPAMEQK